MQHPLAHQLLAQPRQGKIPIQYFIVNFQFEHFKGIQVSLDQKTLAIIQIFGVLGKTFHGKIVIDLLAAEMPIGQSVADHLAQDFFPGFRNRGGSAASQTRGQQNEYECSVFHDTSLGLQFLIVPRFCPRDNTYKHKSVTIQSFQATEKIIPYSILHPAFRIPESWNASFNGSPGDANRRCLW